MIFFETVLSYPRVHPGPPTTHFLSLNKVSSVVGFLFLKIIEKKLVYVKYFTYFCIKLKNPPAVGWVT
jgi:hypothetical protein